MASKRETANRKNAALSTGPRTPAGKATSSLNAVSHGLTSTRALLPGEDPLQIAALEKSLASQYEDLPVAQSLCTQYASVFWRLARLRRLEAISLILADVGEFAKLTESEEDWSAKNGTTLKHLAAKSSMDRYELSSDLNSLIERMSDLSRYEAMLFAQLVRLTDMLEPYRLLPDEDRALPPSSTPGEAG